MMTPTEYPEDLAADLRRSARHRRVTRRTLELKQRVRALFWLQQLQLDAERRGPGYTWRGWWYPRSLVLGLAWLAIVVLFGLLVVGLFTHPTLGA